MRRGIFPFAAIMAAGAIMASAGYSSGLAPATEVVNVSRQVRRRRQLAAGTISRYAASKNPPHRRRLKRNRLHVSRRARLRHRRARRAA